MSYNVFVDDPFVGYITLVVFICIAAGLYVMGGNSERERLYNKCLESNSTMAYHEAVAKCKEFIK